MINTRLSIKRGLIEVPAYTNGRRLSARDLLGERYAWQSADHTIARAAGYGVIDGLEVEKLDTTLLRVRAGSGITRDGQIIDLSADHTIDLSASGQNITVVPHTTLKRYLKTKLFEDCDTTHGPVKGDFQAGTNQFQPDPPGVYLLIARPREIPVSDPYDIADAAFCENRLISYGIEFSSVLFSDDTTGAHFRNQIAYQAFGGQWTASRLADPFADPAESPLEVGIYGALNGDLSALPLALYYWANKEIIWVDLWAGRRRIVQPSAASLSPVLSQNASLCFEPWVSDRAAAEGEARLYQFQDALAGVTCNSSVLDRFDWLPPAGYLPLCVTESEVRGEYDGYLRYYVQQLVTQYVTAWIEHEILSHVPNDPGFNPELAQAVRKALAHLQNTLINQVIEAYYKAMPDPQAGVHVATFWDKYRDAAGILRASWDNNQFIEPQHVFMLLDTSWRDRMIDVEAREPVHIYNVWTDAPFFRAQLWYALQLAAESLAGLDLLEKFVNSAEMLDRLLRSLVGAHGKSQLAQVANAAPTLYAFFVREQRPRSVVIRKDDQ